MSDSLSGKKLRVGIFFGGQSAEHEVSLQSAKNVLEAIDQEAFDPVLIGIDKQGGWHIQDPQLRLEAVEQSFIAENMEDSVLTLLPGRGELIDVKNKTALAPIDVALPILHGSRGEDGTIQGFLELANIPYVGPNVLGSAVGMDKDVMKRLLREAGIPIADFKVFKLSQKTKINAEDIFDTLGVPVFVKPANMGSSVGVKKAENAAELRAALDEAFSYDSKILIEAAIDGDEIECAVLGNEHPEASVVGRIIPRKGDFYSYEAKYIDENGAIIEIPAHLPSHLSERARELAVRVFEVLACEGMSRVDMFLTKDEKILVNEINTIPGFTKISMYPKLWEASGVSYSQLITKLIHFALERHQRQHALRTNYNS
jgi:D-alanine-D-alanine ligase